MDSFISIVIPLYNEEESAEVLVEKIVTVMDATDHKYEIVLIDDGSSDMTWSKIILIHEKYSNIRGLKFRRNFGQTAAMVAGFDHAFGDLIVTLDGDLQNDPADIPRMIKKLNDEDCDIVSGWRKDRRDHYSRVLPSKIANYIISKTTGVYLNDYGCSLKVYRADCIRSIDAYGEMHRFFPALASMTGAKVTEIPVTHHERKFGQSKYGFDRIFKVFSDIFSMNLIIRFSSTPLKGFCLLAMPFGIISAFFGLLGIMALLYNWTAGKALFFFISMALLAMAFIHLIGLGIIGELVLNTSDLKHTQLPELTKKDIEVNLEKSI
jgi:glycosyltransferase involved in cell wall biosynthesis